jgi:hypothetical protein
MSVAKIMASLGLDASGFTSNIDAAKSKVNGFGSQLKSFSNMMKAGLGLYGVNAALDYLVGKLDELKKYTKETGIKILSDDTMQITESAIGNVEHLKNIITGTLLEGVTNLGARLKYAYFFWAEMAKGKTASEAEGTASARIREKSPRQIQQEADELIKKQKEIADEKKKRLEEAKKNEEEYDKFMTDTAMKQLEAEQKRMDDEKEARIKNEEEANKIIKEAREKMLKDLGERERREMEIKISARDKIFDLVGPTRTESVVGVSPSAGAAGGMFGGVDRSGVAIISNQMRIQQELKRINADMLVELTKLNGGE